MNYTKIITGFISASLFCLMLVAGVRANDSDKAVKHHVTFNIDVYVNDTLVKKGTYRVTFDSETSEVKFQKSGDKGVVATAKVTSTMMDEKAENDTVTTRTTDKGMILTSIKFGGEKMQINFASENTTAGGQ